MSLSSSTSKFDSLNHILQSLLELCQKISTGNLVDFYGTMLCIAQTVPYCFACC